MIQGDIQGDTWGYIQGDILGDIEGDIQGDRQISKSIFLCFKVCQRRVNSEFNTEILGEHDDITLVNLKCWYWICCLFLTRNVCALLYVYIVCILLKQAWCIF